MSESDPSARLTLSLDEPEARRPASLARELWQFVCATGKWWLVPVLLALVIVGAALVLSASPYAPFLYSLF